MTSQRLTFLGLESLGWGLLLMVCFAVAVGLVIWIYRYERQLVSRPVGWGLLSLRLTVLCLLLLMALQPTLTWTNTLKEQMRVLVALDVSESMDLIDTHATPEERLQWAVSLGMMKADLLDDQGRPVRSTTDSGDADERDSAAVRPGAAEDEMTEAWNSLSRFELARQLLAAPQIGLLDRLKVLGVPEVVLFSKRVRGTNSQDFTGARVRLSEDLVPEVTAFSAPLEAAVALENCAAVVLITDGVDTAGDQPLRLATQLAGQNRPIFGLLTGSANPPVDLAIESIDHPDAVYEKDQPLIRVRASTHGFENEALQVTLTDVTTGQRIVKDVVGGARFVDTEFQLPLNTAGRQRFIVELHPAAGGSRGREELRTDNNQQEFSINVVDDTTHVLLVDGEGRWEFRFLESAYQRDERVELKAVLFEQPYLGLLPHSFYESSLPRGSGSKGPFGEQDLVILGDTDSRDIDRATWEQLEKFVAEQGGTLAISSGRRHFAGLSQNPVLSRLLPIEHYRPLTSGNADTLLSPRERGFHLQLTPQGKQHPVLKLETDEDKNAAAWRKLPGHLWGYGGVPKPGAAVLATAIGAEAASNPRDQLGVIVVQNYGLGRVMWLGIDSTWRWRSRTGDRDHYRFWGQLSRWAAEMRSSAGSDDVRFAIDQSEIQVGEETAVRARWASKLSQNASEIQAFVEIYPAGIAQTVPLASFPLEGLETEPLLHEGRVPALPEGEYRLVLKARDLPLGPVPIETTLTVIPRRNSETNRLAASRELLEQFAAVSQGDVFLPHQLDQLLARLSPESLELQQKSDVPLWNHWLLFLIMLMVLAGEWLLRKWYGLP